MLAYPKVEMLKVESVIGDEFKINDKIRKNIYVDCQYHHYIERRKSIDWNDCDISGVKPDSLRGKISAEDHERLQ